MKRMGSSLRKESSMKMQSHMLTIKQTFNRHQEIHIHHYERFIVFKLVRKYTYYNSNDSNLSTNSHTGDGGAVRCVALFARFMIHERHIAHI